MAGLKFSHLTAAFVLFSVLVGLLVNFYAGMEDKYGVVKGDVKTFGVKGLGNSSVSASGNIVDQFDRMNLRAGIEKISNGFLRVTSLTNIGDVIGGLLMSGLGLLQTIFGIVVLPYEIVSIILTFYGGEIPGVIGGLVAMIVVYAGFILLSIKTGSDL